jgi:transposase
MEEVDPKDLRITRLEQELAAVKVELARALTLIQDLQDRLSKNSTNSGKPPSSDPPGVERRSKPPTGRKPGGWLFSSKRGSA